MEALETRQNVGRPRSIGPENMRELGEAMRGIRQEAARMREDDPGSRIPVHDAVQDELDGRSGGIEWIVDERAGDASCWWEWQPGMQEHDGLAAGQFRPQRLGNPNAQGFFGIGAEGGDSL